VSFTRLTDTSGRGQTYLPAHKSIPRLGMETATWEWRQVRSRYSGFSLIMLISQAIRGIRVTDLQ